MKTKSLSFICIFLLFLGFSVAIQAQELWGMTRVGGTNTAGIIFEWGLGAQGFFNTNFDFEAGSGASHPGGSPEGSLMIASNGNLYGMTSRGGANNRGTLFEYNPATFTYTKKNDFDGTTGSNPVGSLIQASNGIIYGMAIQGGSGDSGVFFEFNPISGAFAKIFDFGTSGLGRNPGGSLIQASNGKLYGMTVSTIFEYDINTGTKVGLKTFSGGSDGGTLEDSLLQATNGKLYGMARSGGVGFGTLFEYDLTNSTFTKLLDFGNGKGTTPLGGLMQASNGKLYGLTWFGGANNLGVLFEYDISTNTYTKKFDFDGANHGSEPKGTLLEASNGKFYGTTYQGGLNGLGTLFEYNLDTDTLTKKQDMGSLGTGTTVTGYLPTKILVERSTSSLGVSEVEKKFEFRLYPNPTNNLITLHYKRGITINSIKLFSSIGRLIKQFKVAETDLNISKLPAGLYILKIETDKGIINRKILKE